MSQEMSATADAQRRSERPTIAAIGWAEVPRALARGFADLRRTPAMGMAIGGFFAAGGWGIYLVVDLAGFLFLAYPLAAGFALVGPFAAVALYEISRVLETGGTPRWGGIFRVVTGSGAQSLGWMPMLNLFVFLIWVDVAAALFIGFFGLRRPELAGFLPELLGTPRGLVFLGAGNAVGAVFALGVFGSTVAAYPLLLDRDTDFITAIATSWRAVRANPGPMIGYGVLVAALIFASILTGLVGLVVVLPLLGHATWHLYRQVVRWPGQAAAPSGRTGS